MKTLRRLTLLALICAASTLSFAQQPNYQGLWWGGPSEGGWNISFSHQDDIVFALWATYDEAGKATWFSMTAPQSGPDTFSGTLYKTHYDPIRTDGPRVSATEVGSATLVFASTGTGTFSYRVGGVERSKPIMRFVSTPAACVFNPVADPTLWKNYTDIWWADPAGSDPGWAVAISYMPDLMIITLFTYNSDGSPTWFFGSAAGVYGDYDANLYRLTGPSYLAPTFDPNSVKYVDGGYVEVEQGYGNTLWLFGGGFGLPDTSSRKLARFVFRGKGTSCE